MKSLIPYAQLVRLPNIFTAMADIVLGYLVMAAARGASRTRSSAC